MPRDVSRETMYKLQVEMSKPISDSDEPGFIYVYQTEELGSDGRNVHNFYKIGRTINLPRRLYQWNKGCGKLVKLVESFPSDVSSSTSVPNPQSPYSHRLERLIHIHLADKYKVEPFYCGGCSRYHTEWFMVPCAAHYTVKYPGWTLIREIIQHWLRYVHALQANQGRIGY
ncbi:DUF1766-domain-containing protein [Basidiobolus meristosporus CBS 931.73]|uniref:DUF1766-domain-containing protein n=1 Tax=Basidiobolus meristosporus CBS 931.73 TaxID=1314790 RepID=A0A1Y1YE24_9FUNG|nr:DUF1766-domain-containing protein [Basidiobolus meristosporus CBS 931.73]|eukprot:ORX96257.1 DUF1766-domain-containing protein [Basidiobolus meristosporus CBS 931.73]